MSSLAARMTRLEQHLAKQRARLTPEAEQLLAEIQRDPTRIMIEAGLDPDPWQRSLLTSSCKEMLLLCCRQAGKSLSSAAVAIREAISKPGALILLLSPTLRQSQELFRSKVMKLINAINRRHSLGNGGPVIGIAQKTALTLELMNGSRIISLPENEEGIRGYSEVDLLVIDEASRVSDALYIAVRPMLAVSGGKLICLSTPFGSRGFFFREWEGKDEEGRQKEGDEWERFKITAYECPRISRKFLLQEYRSLGGRYYSQEYEVNFVDAIDSVFSFADVQAAMLNPKGYKPLFEEETEDDDEGIPAPLFLDS